ncbi:hypothetical protein BPOR_0699g00090 [Botrytis porri]|uniref:Uncharacterized protein n=2 Tax=Botrytis porri TaxID=87229 RepID=A0A4Z1KAT0_9HELO|nr:hypothetical protein BPOR_0699g00090 [Botrytis porri]
MSPISSLQTKFSSGAASGEYSSIESEENLKSPTWSPLYGLGGKIVFLSAILSPIFLLLLVLNLRTSSRPENDYTARTILGEIPWIRRTFSENENFLHIDPYDGQAWTLYKNKNFDPERQFTSWDDIYPSNFIAVENPQQFGFQGGV